MADINGNLEMYSAADADSLGNGEKKSNPWIFSDSEFLPFTAIFKGVAKYPTRSGTNMDVLVFDWLAHTKILSLIGADDHDLTEYYGKRSDWVGKQVRLESDGKPRTKVFLKHVEETVQ